MRKSLLFLLTFNLVIACLSSVSPAQQSISKVVYIDPTTDNDLVGPAIKQKNKAQKLLLNIAHELKSQLNARGDVAHVSDQGVKDVEDRIDQAKEKHSSLFVSLTLSKADKDCIRIHFPKFTTKDYKKGKDTDKAVSEEMFNMLGNSARKTVSDESKTVATLISKNINKSALASCNKLMESDSYVLKIASFPTLIIEFQLPDIDNLSSYLISDNARQISTAIAEAVNEFLSYPIGSPKRMGSNE